MRVLHQQPTITLRDNESNIIASLQVLPLNINLDNLNHIWSTQNEVSYRLSIAYELALGPIPFTLPHEKSPLVGENEFQARSDMDEAVNGTVTNLANYIPGVEYLDIDINEDNDYWIPHICYIDENNDIKSLHYVKQITTGLADDREIYLAGRSGGEVTMYWDIWRRKTNNDVEAWQEEISDETLPAIKVIEKDGGQDDPYTPNIVDPDQLDSRKVVVVRLPAIVSNPETKSWQALLYAVRGWQHEEPLGSGTYVTTHIKSNKLLFYGSKI